MSTFWLKLALVIVLIVAAVVIVSKFATSRRGQEEQPAPQEKTVYDVWQEDDKRLRAEPNVAPTGSAGQAASAQQGEQKPAMKFKELTEEEQAGAEQLFEMAIASRKMARLPAMGYGQMVDYCRQIIEKCPGSEFDYKSRRMLGEVPREQWGRYKITEQEINPAQ